MDEQTTKKNPWRNSLFGHKDGKRYQGLTTWNGTKAFEFVREYLQNKHPGWGRVSDADTMEHCAIAEAKRLKKEKQ